MRNLHGPRSAGGAAGRLAFHSAVLPPHAKRAGGKLGVREAHNPFFFNFFFTVSIGTTIPREPLKGNDYRIREQIRPN